MIVPVVLTKKKVIVACLGLSVAANIAAGVVIFKGADDVESVKSYKEAEQKYPLLSKRILQEIPQDLLLNFYDLRKQIIEQTTPYKASFGMYFEYLPTGTSIGVNSNDQFYAASLFKVPVIMAYYHAMERTQKHNDPTLTLKKDMLDSEFGSLWKKGEGYQLKASEAVRLALVDSDNTAAKVIVPFVTDKDFKAVYDALDIELHADKKGALVSARQYSSVLKALYFASILTKDDSEVMLDLLSKTHFSDKLAAGVPPNILVAHKIGDFIDKDGNTGFRDCGIVYVPRRPYVLCMFSVGNEQLARERMQMASNTIYNYVSRSK